ncbi:MAG: hypothetical protein HOM24_01985, partial [Flavobacteriales bacterium]|nr:hypothetical protein [Flavobacteriales bacterium]
MKKLFLLFLPLLINAQDVPIGYWKDYQSYTSASYIAEADNKIYCVTNGGLFYINKEDNTINRISKVTGLSDVGIKQVAYSKELLITIITYENCNIDLLKENSIINISDIKHKDISGLKSINNITVKGGIAYLSTTFELVLVDLEKEEIKDTYTIEKNGSILEINDCAIIYNLQILAATSLGLYVGSISSILNDPNNWLLYGGEMSAVNVIRNDNIGCVLYSDNQESYLEVFYPPEFNMPLSTDPGLKKITYTNGVLHKLYEDSLVLTNNGSNAIASITDEKIINTNYSISDSDNTMWLADSITGLLKFKNYEYQESFIPEGPARNDVYSLEFAENKLYQCHGGHANFGLNALINDGASIKDEYDDWENYDFYTLGNARDILEVAVRNETEYYASWYDGITEIKDGKLITKHGYSNTNGVLDTAYYSNNRIRISDLKFDNDGNLWGLSSEVNHPLFVKTKNGEWYSFTMHQSQVDLFFDDLLIDSYNQKWGILGRGAGVFVYSHNNTIENFTDDQYKLLNTNVGNGNLPSLQTYSIAEDLNGEIWVGTDKGIGIFYNPSSVFSGGNFDAQQILIQEEDYGQYLLSEEKVKCITIDGANRKWIGTEKSGVFLLSEEGSEEILHFTAENSPLFSNNIIDIAISSKNGEVFIGTKKGLISYRSDATKGASTQGKTHVFPNPVRESYSGPIAIKGLVSDANIKITDIDGNLVFEGFAKGGQALWNGKNKNGERASTGVYL